MDPYVAQRGITRRQFLLGGAALFPASLVVATRLEPWWLEVLEESIPALRHEKDGSTVRILHMSDLHFSNDVPLSHIQEAIGLGLGKKPDIIVITGDFISSSIPDPDGYRDALNRLSDAAPSYACLGNHDGGIWASHHGGISTPQPVSQLLHEAGVQVLANESCDVTVGTRTLRLIGVHDLWSGKFDPHHACLHSNDVAADAHLLLCHNPDGKDALGNCRWDVMLSGHTHGGQMILPLVGAPLAPVRDHRFVMGLHRWNHRWIHVSKGVGNMHGIRINCRPDIAILDLVPAGYVAAGPAGETA